MRLAIVTPTILDVRARLRIVPSATGLNCCIDLSLLAVDARCYLMTLHTQLDYTLN